MSDGLHARGPERPTPERALHDPIEITPNPVIWEPGEYESPAIVIDILESMERRGVIDSDERLAGSRFREWFLVASLGGVRASDLSRPYVDGGSKRQPDVTVRAEMARREIARAIRFLQASGPLVTSCVWDVLGLDQSLREWARTRTRTLSHQNASGILAAALERLARMPWAGPGEK